MPCCGKGSNTRKNVGVNTIMSRGSVMTMALDNKPAVGSMGMERIEYLGGQMNFTISGDTTNVKYTFGKDRPRGWVDKRDVGTSEGKLGFLSKKGPDGKPLYRLVASENGAAPVSEPVAIVEVTAEETPAPVDEVTIKKHGAVGMSEMLGTLTASETATVIAPKLEVPDPKDLTAVEIQALNLNRDQWEKLYALEMAGRNRKILTAWLENLLANWGADG